MRFNESAVKQTAKMRPFDREGRLNYKPPRENYRERWIRLKGNLLFIFKTADHGSISETEITGMHVIEHCKIMLEPLADRPFVFSIAFEGEGGRKHYFSGKSEKTCQDWVTALQTASIENLQVQLAYLRQAIKKKTGQDPLTGMIPTHFKRSCKVSNMGSSTFFTTNTSPSVNHTHKATGISGSSHHHHFHTRRNVPASVGQTLHRRSDPTPAKTSSKVPSKNSSQASITNTETRTHSNSASSELLLNPSGLSGWELFE